MNFQGDPQPLRDWADLRLIARQMKIAAADIPDDPHSGYTKTDEDVVRLMTSMKTLGEQARIPPGCSRTMMLGPRFFSICLTSGSESDMQWHLSVSESGMRRGVPSMLAVDDATLKIIGDTFFGEWREIENPGRLKTIKHLIGRD